MNNGKLNIEQVKKGNKPLLYVVILAVVILLIAIFMNILKKKTLYCTMDNIFSSDSYEEYPLTSNLQLDFIGNIPKTANMTIKVSAPEQNLEEITTSLKDRLSEHENTIVDVTHDESTVTAIMQTRGRNIKKVLGYDGGTSYNKFKTGLEKQGYKCK